MPRPVRYQINLKLDPDYAGAVDRNLLRKAARTALEVSNAPEPAALTIAITGDAGLRELNRTYLAEDRPTDVLSFPSGETDPDTGRRYLGDIAISLPRARAQARAGGHPLAAELQLLVVHGALHLLGHDHAVPLQKDRMWAAQANILQRLKNPLAPS